MLKAALPPSRRFWNAALDQTHITGQIPIGPLFPVFKLVILVSKGLIRSQHARRLIMFYDVIFALLMLFAGSSVLSHWLRKNPLFFMIYWGACTWLTILAFLLAIFDMVQVRAAARRERRRLETEYVAKTDE